MDSTERPGVLLWRGVLGPHRACAIGGVPAGVQARHQAPALEGGLGEVGEYSFWKVALVENIVGANGKK